LLHRKIKQFERGVPVLRKSGLDVSVDVTGKSQLLRWVRVCMVRSPNKSLGGIAGALCSRRDQIMRAWEIT
jgi:hypothetical protein